MPSERRLRKREKISLQNKETESKEILSLDQSVRNILDTESERINHNSLRVLGNFTYYFSILGVSALLMTLVMWSYSPHNTFISFTDAFNSYSLLMGTSFGIIFGIGVVLSFIFFLFNLIILTRLPMTLSFQRLKKSLAKAYEEKNGVITERSISISNTHLLYSAAGYWWLFKKERNSKKFTLKQKFILSTIGNFFIFTTGGQVIYQMIQTSV